MVAGAVGVMALAASSWGQTADALIDKLVEKGILSVKEANNLREETDKGFNQAYAVKSGMPDWVNSLKLNGDFRARYEGIYQDKDNAMIGVQPPFTSPSTAFTEDRNRFRYRARFGITVAMVDQFEVGLRLASGDGIAGGSDPLSTNTTLDRNATKKAVNIDLAYGRWTPKDWVMLEVGKMNNEFWMSEMVFDTDYTPEGAQEKLIYAINDKHSISWTSGQFVISENFAPTGNGNNNDTYLLANQVEWAAKWTPKISSRTAVSLMNFVNNKDNTQTTPPGSNNTGGNQGLLGNGSYYNITPIIVRGELTYLLDSFPLFNGAFPIVPGVEYAHNLVSGLDKNEAWNVGVTFGSSKVKGNWQVSYNYKDIGLNSVWAALTDSDFGVNGSGGTDNRGHVIKASYRPYDPLSMNLSFYLTEKITLNSLSHNSQMRMQADLVWTY